MDSAKNQLVDRLKTANSVLITVSRDPTVDQLAACIGLTLLVNKLGKHGSAVFSGNVPSTIEFLKPEETIEKNADSLRDFIIALDKNKADKLRYKVEDQVVKIFITPYKTSLSEKDLEFSQGDFNVDLVIALGVKQQEDLDQAIVAHGRILHDATVSCINTIDQSNLGTINWQDPAASSLCELVTDLASTLGDNLLDEQIATALLTGIIAETDRFSNEKTTSQTMSVSGQLMAAGANQQLVATNLEPADEQSAEVGEAGGSKSSDDGTLSIDHDKEDLDISTLPKPTETETSQENPPEPSEIETSSNPPKLVTEPPILGGTLTANSMPEQYDPSTDPLSNLMATPPLPPAPDTGSKPTMQPSPPPQPIINPSPQAPVTESPTQSTFTPPPPSWTPPPAPNPSSATLPAANDQLSEKENTEAPKKGDTIKDLEQAVNSPHLKSPDVDAVREKIDAIRSQTPGVKPDSDVALNALPLGGPLHDNQTQKPSNNTTGLDPSLFSELPSSKDKAPPVPPPFNFPIKDDSKEDNTKSS